jgi:hypothetical protein
MINQMKTCGPALLLIAGLLLISPMGHAQETSQPGSELSVETAQICEGVENREPTNPGTSFSVSVGRLYCFTKIVGAAEPVEVTHVWYYGDVERARVSLSVRAAAWRTYSSKAIQAHEIGAWKVEVLGPDGAVLETVTFETVQ